MVILGEVVVLSVISEVHMKEKKEIRVTDFEDGIYRQTLNEIKKEISPKSFREEHIFAQNLLSSHKSYLRLWAPN